MIINEKIRDVKYDIKREAAKLSALSSSKIDKYEYLTGEEILSPQKHRITQEAEICYLSLGNEIENKNKN